MAREFASIGVVGLGTMGAGIVEVLARNGLGVVAVEVSDDALERGRQHLIGSTERAVARGKLGAGERDALLGRIRFAVGLGALSDVDLAIEAVPERLDLKRQIFADLDKVCRPDAILATNTSSLSVTDISVATTRPHQVVGLHFFNPAPVMRLVEVVKTVVTAPEVVADVEALCARLGKVDVTIADRAGFIANALLFGYLNHAVTMVEARYVSREDVDAAMRLGCGLPMGPLALIDLIGTDTAYEILDTMYHRGGRDRRHAPAPLLGQMVTAGLLGRKSGRGFYTYEKPGSPVTVADDRTPADDSSTDAGDGIRGVGVVGAGAKAERVASAFTAGGYEVIAVGPDTLRASGLDQADLLVDAVADELTAKAALFGALGEIARPGAILATTGARRPVIECAVASGRPADVVGLHFFDPPLTMDAIEVVQTIRTAPETLAAARAVVRRLGKYPVSCADRAGFVVNALLFPYLGDAVRMVEANYASADDIDAAMKLGCGYPAGPFEMLDAIGLDVALATVRQLYREMREPGFAPAPLLEQLVTAGYLGRKAGRGFREYRD